MNLAKLTNFENQQGSLEEILKGADAFIGVSAAGALKKAWVNNMAPKAIVFAMANPDPEITLEDAL